MIYFEVENLDRFRIRIRSRCAFCRRQLSQRTYDVREELEGRVDQEGTRDATQAYQHLKRHALYDENIGKKNP